MTDKPRKICFVTGSRADFGLLIWPMRAIQETAGLKLQLIATGMHLSPEFGYTIDNIRAEGFAVDDTVETLLSSDSGVGVAKSVGLGVIGFADAFARLAPDLVVVLGDRYEPFAAAQAAMYMRLPMAHLFGGDVTEGAIDESIRTPSARCRICISRPMPIRRGGCPSSAKTRRASSRSDRPASIRSSG
jgi:UDP-N-acetylglucosamine 2-epimerase (non-hydrolysing)/GDP/UDP-N,N'-diacetylbacillosamine 2-epimerase (hydrolysing)